MNERIQQLAEQATEIVDMVGPHGYASSYANFDREKFAELIVADYAQQQVQVNMSNPAYARAMDEYYEKKWSHRFD